MTKSPLNNEQQLAHAQRVRAMFAGIAPRYDLLNHLLSAGIDRRWRRLVARRLESEVGRGARVLDVARPKSAAGGGALPFVEGDALRLPFAGGEFDAATIAFGLRNLADVEGGLAELFRVTRPGGVVFVLEFSRPVVPGFRGLFNFYFTRVLPRVGGLISGSRGAYEYLPDSVSRFPDQAGLAGMMRAAGFERVVFENLTGGIAALHTGARPLCP